MFKNAVMKNRQVPSGGWGSASRPPSF